MKVRELIEQLSTFDPEGKVEVCAPGETCTWYLDIVAVEDLCGQRLSAYLCTGHGSCDAQGDIDVRLKDPYQIERKV